jgi:hypothetical protein
MKLEDISQEIKNLPTYIGTGFRTMAEGRNIIENTKEYTSNMKDSTKKYYGRGGAGGFICKHGIYNQFIDLSKQDGKWDNRFIGDRFIESWKNPNDVEEIDEWKEGKKDMIIRLFIKEVSESKYMGQGIYYYNGSSQTGVMWSLLK